MLSQELVDKGLVPSHFSRALFVDGFNWDDVHNDFKNDNETLKKEQGSVYIS